MLSMQQICEMTVAHLFLNPQTLYFVVTEETQRFLKVIKYWTNSSISDRKKKKGRQYDFHIVDLLLKGRVWLLTAQKS